MDAAAVLEVEASTPGSPLDRALRPEMSRWTHEAQMLRLIEWQVRMTQYQLAGGDESDNDRPELLPLIPDRSSVDEAFDVDEAHDRLGWSLPGADAQPLEIDEGTARLGWSL